MHRRIKIWQRQIAISMQSIPKSVIEPDDLHKSYQVLLSKMWKIPFVVNLGHKMRKPI